MSLFSKKIIDHGNINLWFVLSVVDIYITFDIINVLRHSLLIAEKQKYYTIFIVNLCIISSVSQCVVLVRSRFGYTL